VAAVQQIRHLDRHAVRQRFAERFTVEHMAGNYLEVYRRLPGFALDHLPSAVDEPESFARRVIAQARR
jgi:hypothetical protein